jgi:4-amino-4-deoxy-L-arabinose transferase-like glycosyltransferase
LPWFIALEKRQPGFTYNFLIAENLGRFSGSEDYHDPTPLWFYVPVLLVGLVPWTAFVGTAVAALRQRDDDIKRRHARWFLWIWAFFIIIFFSKSSTKLFSYILPSFPALALLLGDGILSAIRPGEKSRKGALVALLLINVLGAIGAAIYLLDGKTMPRPTALPYAVSTTLILGTAAYFGWKFWRAGEAWKVVVSQFACAVAFYVCLLAMAQKVALYEDSSSLLRALRPHLKPSDEIILTSSFSPTAIYYARRPIYLVNFKNNSGLEEKALEKSPYFIKMEPKYLKLLLQRRQRTFVMLRWRRKDYEVPPGVYTWARNNDFKLICNQPPDDYRYDYTAPKKAALDTDWRFGPPPDS